MRDAGRWCECCYVLIEDRSSDDVATLMGGHLDDVRQVERDAARRSAEWPSLGPASKDWTVLVDRHVEFGDADKQLQEWSKNTRIVRLLLIERALFSHASAWADGELVWQASFDGEVDGRPSIIGRTPVELDVRSRQFGPIGDPRAWYRLPIAAVELVTGWRPACSEDRTQPSEEMARSSFAQVVYPRPVGVAAEVARNLAK